MPTQVRLAVIPEVVTAAAASAKREPLYGIYRPHESLIQVLSRFKQPSPEFRRVAWANPTERVVGPRLTVQLEQGEFAIELEKDLPAPDRLLVLGKTGDLDDRRRGLVPEQGLARFEVHHIGAGSLGSAVGLLLAQAGVGLHRYYDRDVLDTANLARHICGLADLGREKATATSERISMFGCNALGATVDIEKLEDRQLDLLLKPADVVVATTDSPVVQFVVNEAVVRTGKIGLFSGAYELARAGEVLVVRPGKGPCLYCATGFRATVSRSAAPHERRQAYQRADMNRLTAEPGLGLDITYLASVVAAHVLAVLDPAGSRAELLAHGGFTLLHGPSAPQAEYSNLFRRPLDVVYARVVREDACPVCGFRSSAEVRS
jgi:molybdopterin/thiamine biosynthesis adenylyltransferase